MPTTTESSGGQQKVTAKKTTQGSRVTNGSALLPGIDGRSAWVRRCKTIIAAYLAERPNATVAECSLVRRAAVISIELERLELRFALAGGADDDALDLYARTSGNLKRLLEAVGLKHRPPKDITPNLSDFLDGGEHELEGSADG